MMNKPLKITGVGNSAAVILPKDLLARLRVEKGDVVFATETPDGVELRAHDPAFEKDMTLIRQIMHEDRDLLAALAK